MRCASRRLAYRLALLLTNRRTALPFPFWNTTTIEIRRLRGWWSIFTTESVKNISCFFPFLCAIAKLADNAPLFVRPMVVTKFSIVILCWYAEACAWIRRNICRFYNYIVKSEIAKF